jgi:hypothetical protein
VVAMRLRIQRRTVLYMVVGAGFRHEDRKRDRSVELTNESNHCLVTMLNIPFMNPDSE